MRLQEKLESIKKENIVPVLNSLLKTVKVSNSYTGQRMVEIAGFEGQVTINELAEIFLKASAFIDDSPSLEDRLACDDLWEKIKNLYAISDKQLSNSKVVFQTLTFFREFRPYCRACSGDPQAIIGEWDFGGQRSSLFEFKPEEFKALFKNQDSVGKSWSSRGEFWLATREMVEEAYQQQTKKLSM